MVETSSWSPPKTVLVTGGTGFVGTYVCQALAAQGQSPIALDFRPFSPEFSFVLGKHAAETKFIQCDIRDPAGIEVACTENAVDAIIHVAGYVGHEKSMEDPARTYAVNVSGTVNVLEAARKANIQKVVIISTNSVYHTKAYEPFDELHPITSVTAGNPNAHYGTSKMAAEQISLAYYTFHGLDVVAARITSVYGFGMGRPTIVQLVQGAVRGEPVVIETGAAVKRDYTYVDDTVAGIVKMLNTDTRNLKLRVYNIARGELVSAAEIAETVRGIFPNADLHVGTELTELEQSTVDQRAPLSTDAARDVFGIECGSSIEDGVREYADTYTRYLAAQR